MTGQPKACVWPVPLLVRAMRMLRRPAGKGRGRAAEEPELQPQERR